VLSVAVRRFLLILAVLAAAVPAAAGAQIPAPTPPVATTGAAESIAQTGATLTGTVDRNAGATTYRFEYGTSTAYGLTTTETAIPTGGSDPVTVKAPITGLTRDTTYNYRLVATNPAGISRGPNRTFRTAPGPRPPAVTSTAARDVSSRGARLITTVDPNGLETSVRFQYGRTTSYGSFTSRVSAGAGERGVPVFLPLAGLRPNTRYHVRAVATNAAGTTRSSRDRSFVTLREPTGVSIALTPRRVIWGGGVTVLGRLAGSGVGGTPLALERQDFPFTAAFTQVGATRTASSSGSFRFELPSVLATTHVRVVTRSTIVVASPIRTVSSAVRVGARARSTSRRGRIAGSIRPLVPQGRVSLQKRSPRGRWAVVRRKAARPLGETRSRYAFSVKRGRRAGRYRVVVLARDGGAHVPGRSRVVRVKARPKRR